MKPLSFQTLTSCHPVSEEKFKEEVANAVDLLYETDHLHYFFTDRDGTLKSYACSYPSSIQPAYSGVIQVTKTIAEYIVVYSSQFVTESGLYLERAFYPCAS
ncbi:hypothetical protein ANCCAN_10565 [Ancylostoma caninum]|uniref:Trehalose-6-phosphate phosphatase C-terminal domain-containing protein n=1 Tax=Ancylostoma caninum TaxID=29170 RepID=A0A368GJK4_ANCCA|nr:hypothetical protein ANCCAN_10565 [Ancylostoma caninum]